MLAAASLVSAQRPAPPIPKGANVLFGRVVDMGTGQPVGGAVVTLVGYFDASGRPADRLPDSAAGPLASAPRFVMTTADGYFIFRGLPAGRYSLAADAFSYVNETYPLHLVELADRDTPIEVALRLWKTGSISGNVIDEQGEPVVGVMVTAFRCIAAAGGVMVRSGIATVDTDDRGAYRIAQLPPGNYAVAVLSSSLSLPAGLAAAIDASSSNAADSWALTRELLKGGSQVIAGDGQRIGDFVLRRPGPPPLLAPDGRMLTYQTTMYPGTPNPAEATVITLGSGEALAGIDVPVRFAPTVDVSGIAVGPDGPVSDLTIDLQPPGGATTRIAKVEPTGTGLFVSTIEPVGLPRAITDASGRFRFLTVSPGSYVLQAALIDRSAPDAGRPDVSLSVSLPLAVGDRGIAGLTVALHTGARVSGRVEFKDSNGPPLPAGQRLFVGLQPVGAGFWRSLQGDVGPDGTYTTHGDPPGRYIVFTMNSLPGWSLESVTRAGKTLPDDVIDLETADVADVVLTFSKSATRVSGSVGDVKGAPDVNADVIVFPADSTLWREGIFNNRRTRMMHATSAGSFEFSGLAPGDYFIAAVRALQVRDWQDPAFLARLVPVATKFALAGGEAKTVSLRTIAPVDK